MEFKDDNKRALKICLLLTAFMIFISFFLTFYHLLPNPQEDFLAQIPFIRALAYTCTIFLVYCCVNAALYSLTVTKEQIKLRHLNKKIEINIADIDSFSYKKQGISCFYLFTIYTNGKKQGIFIKCKDEMLKVFEVNNININD